LHNDAQGRAERERDRQQEKAVRLLEAEAVQMERKRQLEKRSGKIEKFEREHAKEHKETV
jgi:hypothetical protein